MSAAFALARAEAAGIHFSLSGGTVQMKADRPPPPDLLEDLRSCREEVKRLLAAREGVRISDAPPPQPPPAPTMEYDDAERAATAEHYRTPAETPEDRAKAPDAPALHRPTVPSLLRSSMQRPTAWTGANAVPSAGSMCRCCDGRRWWGDSLGWRCAACHPAPPSASNIMEKTT